jgi:O-antigen ligase
MSHKYYWIIALNIIILLALPQLSPFHYDPLPEFFAESTFAWASISIFLITLFAYKHISIPRITIPLALLAIFIFIQNKFVNIDYVGLSYVAGMELVLCIMIAVSFSTLIEEFGIQTIVTTVCVALLIGAILQSAIGFLQYSGMYKILGDFIFYDSLHPSTNIFGHFGQRNHYCHYLSWALFGLIYLFHKNNIKLPGFLIIGAWLIFSITIAASRSVFIYFALASLISLVYFIKNRNRESRNLFILIITASITLVLIESLYPMISNMVSHTSHISSGLQRIADSSDNGLSNRRFTEWQKAWIVFKNNPIFGYGLNEYAKQSINLQILFPNAPLNSGLFTNCHNLILQLLAETGVIGALIVVIGLIYSIYAIIKYNNAECVMILCMIFTTLAHSMVEYPLWYIYFLGPWMIFLSIDKPIFKLSSNVASGIAIIPLVCMVYLLFKASFIMNALVSYVDAPSNKTYFVPQEQYLESLVNNNVLWAYPAMHTLDNYINIDDANTNSVMSAQTQLNYENHFSGFHPYPDNMIKQAQLYWNMGDKAEARRYVRLALISYPVYKSSYLSSLKDKKYSELAKIVKDYQYKK